MWNMTWQNIRKGAFLLVVFLQLILIVAFGLLVRYDKNVDSRTLAKVNGTSDTFLDLQYPLFQDVHVMIFVGFGFLMTFLKKYAFSAVGFTFFVSVLVIQLGIILKGLIRMRSVSDRIYIDIISLIDGDIIAAVFLISFGAILGKTSPLQLICMAIIETLLFVVNEYINVDIFEAVDAGGSMFVHAFGAYFGLAVSFVLGHKVFPGVENNKLEGSSYQSDINSMIGTLFLWLFWPSFNAGLLEGDQKYRAIIHTYLALLASCASAFLMSSILNKEKKFEMVHVQNATLAGGVCIGTSANMMLWPFGALIIGCFAGLFSTIGFAFLQGHLLKKFHIHDTCGVNNLHGMPGIAAGLIGAIVTRTANKEDYGEKLFDVFPAMGPPLHRSSTTQALFQLVSLVVTLAIAIVGGLLTGTLLWKMCPTFPPKEYYSDDLWWEVEKESED